MRTRITGRLITLDETEASIDVGAFEYAVYVPHFVQRQLQTRIGEEISLRTIEYFEGNPQKGRLTPRLIGFTSDAEREFFELICSVDGVGVKKTLKAMVRPVRDVAEAIVEKDAERLTMLPGIGPSVADRVIAKLHRKMTRFALMVGQDHDESVSGVDRNLVNEAHEALIGLGHSTADSRAKLEAIFSSGEKFESVEDVLREVYRQQRHDGG
ncbi:MAG: Holliday junction branch migration protein RuvA [Planctomycetaceae bacterium]